MLIFFSLWGVAGCFSYGKILRKAASVTRTFIFSVFAQKNQDKEVKSWQLQALLWLAEIIRKLSQSCVCLCALDSLCSLELSPWVPWLPGSGPHCVYKSWSSARWDAAAETCGEMKHKHVKRWCAIRRNFVGAHWGFIDHGYKYSVGYQLMQWQDDVLNVQQTMKYSAMKSD